MPTIENHHAKTRKRCLPSFHASSQSSPSRGLRNRKKTSKFAGVAITAALLGSALSSPLLADDLPIERVVLFKSGVGYFEHNGAVQAERNITIPFRTEQVNDVLKSLVVNDPQGAIREVRYPSQDPLERSLSGFAINLSEAHDLPSILQQLRGAEVTIKAPDTVQGRIVAVNTETVVQNDTQMQRVWLTLASADGLQRLDLATISQIRLLDDKLNQELQQALLLLADSQTNDNKNLTMRFGGSGQRDVTVGYIVEAPVWKTSWRLDLNDPQRLQGWALVENTSDSDWNNIELALVSGQPVSFTMDLYTPLYANRPEVAVPKPVQVTPKTYAGATRRFRPEAEAMESDMAMNEVAQPVMAPKMARQSFDDSGLFNVMEMAPVDVSNLTTESVGELFQYQLNQPVTLPRRTSAMLPIIDASIPLKKVSIYNYQEQAKHAMNGVLLTNTSGAKLMAGPVTVYDDGYAGDAQIGHIPAGAKRLLAYAVNLEVLAESEATENADVVSATIIDGVLKVTSKRLLERTYRFSNEADKTSTMIIEHPKYHQFELVSTDELMETTDTHHRFSIELPANKSREFKVQENRIVAESFALLSRDAGNLMSFIKNGKISDNVRETLQEVAQRKQAINQLRRQQQLASNELQQIQNNQGRIRENIKTVDAKSTLGRRYLDKLSEQEDRIDELNEQIQEFQQAINKAEARLREYLNDLGEIE